METGNFLPKNGYGWKWGISLQTKNPDMDGYGSGRTGWSGVGLKILPREGLYSEGILPLFDTFCLGKYLHKGAHKGAHGPVSSPYDLGPLGEKA